MKNITFSADEKLIEKARNVARERNTTLNAAFRQWLFQFAGHKEKGKGYCEIMDRLSYAKPGKKLSRDQMNER